MNYEKYDEMSPFEVKNELIEEANREALKRYKNKEEHKIYNAGRGNPNFLNTLVRLAFSHLNLFITDLADQKIEMKDLGIRPSKSEVHQKLYEYLEKNKEKKEVAFLKKAIDFAIVEFNLDPIEFTFCLCDAALGDYYPMPPRIFPSMEKILRRYLGEVLGLDKSLLDENFDLFATEGAAAAMVYIFKSLKINKVLNPKDKIAIVTPIFSPYLEMPTLSDFDLVEILLESKEDLNWQVPKEELEKLLNPSIKAVYLVNPANPTSVAMSDKIIKTISDFVKTKRKDLIILTDTVYATFVDDFHSLVNEIYENTICVYSFSKYFGVTGWRLGLIMMHKKNIVDKLLRDLSEEDKKELDQRYKIVAAHPREVPFIERLELDSRDEALAHTGGLSGPQQTVMTLLAIYELMDIEKLYKNNIHSKLKTRIKDFFNNLQVEMPDEKGNTYYYALIDFRKIALKKYSKEFADYLEKEIHPLDFLFRLAKEKLTILLPGKGFAGPNWSMRISLANLQDEDYKVVGKNVSDVLEKFYMKWKQNKKDL